MLSELSRDDWELTLSQSKEQRIQTKIVLECQEAVIARCEAMLKKLPEKKEVEDVDPGEDKNPAL